MNKILKGKKLLVQGAGRGNLGIVKVAKDNGVETIVTGLGGDYPCSELADKECIADISDCDAVLEVACKNEIDGAVICCSDTGLRAVGRCNDAMHLSGITEKSAIVSSNKYEMKELLVSNGVRTAPFMKVRNQDEIKKAIEEIGFPVIIKAVDLQGSRGIDIVKDSTQLMASFDNVMSQTHKDFCIVEKFLEGREYGAQSFVYGGEVLFVLPHGDETIMCKTAVPIGHYMPLELSEDMRKDTDIQVKKAIEALGLNNCPVNVDLIEVDGEAYIIELTGRVGANCLPELVSNYYGINYYEMILNTVLGESPIAIFDKRDKPVATMARMIQSDKSGIVNSIRVPNLPNTEILMFVKKGSEVRKFTNSNDAIGQIVVKGSSVQECVKMINRAINSIEILCDEIQKD
ncbi:MAG: ATP-grasp domain-containing protein [Muribaculum sp.]|nr:ATP-grasp domain-containing protein [Muribaculum sp.]